MFSVVSKLINYIYPPTCVLCGKTLSKHEQPPVCDCCEPPSYLGQLAEISCCEKCGEIGQLESDHSRSCIYCEIYPFPLRSLRSLWPYSSEVESLIKRLKYGNKRALAPYFAHKMCEGLALFSQQDWQLVAAVPPLAENVRRRGFHHLAIIGTIIARKLGIQYKSCLSCLRHRLPQASLSLQRRSQNVTNSLTATKEIVAGKRILLIDDVVTSGASIAAACHALYQAGASTIDGFTIARSQRLRENHLRVLNYDQTPTKRAA